MRERETESQREREREGSLLASGQCFLRPAMLEWRNIDRLTSLYPPPPPPPSLSLSLPELIVHTSADVKPSHPTFRRRQSTPGPPYLLPHSVDHPSGYCCYRKPSRPLVLTNSEVLFNAYKHHHPMRERGRGRER